jgi:hypothetical protein
MPLSWDSLRTNFMTETTKYMTWRKDWKNQRNIRCRQMRHRFGLRMGFSRSRPLSLQLCSMENDQHFGVVKLFSFWHQLHFIIQHWMQKEQISWCNWSISRGRSMRKSAKYKTLRNRSVFLLRVLRRRMELKKPQLQIIVKEQKIICHYDN